MIHFSYGTKALREASAKLLFASMFSSLFALRKAAAKNENEFTAEKRTAIVRVSGAETANPLSHGLWGKSVLLYFWRHRPKKAFYNSIRNVNALAMNENEKQKNSLRSTLIVRVLQVPRDVVEFLVGKRFVRSWNCGSDIQSNGRIVEVVQSTRGWLCTHRKSFVKATQCVIKPSS